MSWVIKGQLLFLGVAQYLDFANPKLNITPALGATFDPGKTGGVRLHVETRWYALTSSNQFLNVQWVGGPRGAFGLTLGVSYLLGPKK